MPRYSVPEDSPPPSTPARGGRNNGSLFHFGDNPSTTPAGPPPSSAATAATFTPAGAPSVSYLGSSMMRGVTAQKPVNPINFGSRGSGPSSKNLLSRGSRSPLGRSVVSKGRQPSKLSRQLPFTDSDDDDDAEGDGVVEKPATRSFGLQYSDDEEDEEDEEDEDPEQDENAPVGRGRDEEERQNNRDEIEGGGSVNDDVRSDVWLNLDQYGSPDRPDIGNESDLMDLMTPAINEKVRREAEEIFRASTMHSGRRAAREMNFAPVAKSLYEQMGYAEITEPPLVVLETNEIVSRLYTDGVGTEDDAQRLDEALARASGDLVALWKDVVGSLPQKDEEHVAGIGPGPHAVPFENAAYLATLVLQVHHTRYADPDHGSQPIPLPEVLFSWLGEYHNLYPGQTKEIKNFKPSPACHALFWQTTFMNLLQGRVSDALLLLRAAGFDKVKRGHGAAYSERALSNVQRAVAQTCEVLEGCPGLNNDWDLWNSDWTLFRVRARGALDKLRRFAEGRDQPLSPSDFSDSPRDRQSMAGLARKAESQVPWDVYENINIIFDIVLGDQDRILQVSQDWCEATVAMFGWWDEAGTAAAKNGNLRMSQSLSRSQALLLAPAPRIASQDDYLDRLARSFQASVGSGLEINSNSALEVGIACVFEDNPKGLIGILRTWSLPVAAAVVEIAALGEWLPMHRPPAGLNGFDLDMDDLEVLGLDPRGPDEISGVKDNTLVHYAQSLVNFEGLPLAAGQGQAQGQAERSLTGWELAMHVLGRIDSPERSEEAMGEIVKNVLDEVDVDSGPTVDKVWRLLNDMGMIDFAEDTAEHFGDALARESHSYGQAMWYYSLAHRPSKVREVMNLLISYSLLQSTSFPPEADLDDHLRLLLHDRNETLAQLANQDLEAGKLLGRMLSGYATLRRFYAIRDGGDGSEGSIPAAATLPLPHRRAAAADALIAVISSSDDNVRGGLYDPSRDAVVSEDFLLALLGEATALVDSNGDNGRASSAVIGGGEAAAITLDHIDTLLKAAEDLVAIKSTSVYATCDGFFKLALASASGLKGSTPADLMRRSTGGLSSAAAGNSASSSYVLSGSSMLASQLHRSISAGSLGKTSVKRGWDWRSTFTASTTADDVLRRLRLGVARDLARLWIAEADGRI